MTKLTVLLTVFNGEAYLAETIDSILTQTHRDFRFLIIDNASNDSSRDIVKSFKDSRIQLVALPKNILQAPALNKGLDMVNSEYVARIDADDISLPRRFEKQLAFMDAHPQVGISGTYAVAFGDGKDEPWSWPCDHHDIEVHLLFESCLAHPSVIMRTKMINQYKLRYNEESGHSEDWELWQKAAKCFPLANIPEVHLKYRLHPENESKRILHLQGETAGRLDGWSLSFLKLENHPLRGIHRDVSFSTFNAKNRGGDFLDRVVQWFNVLESANREHKVYKVESLRRFLKTRLFAVLHHNFRFRGAVMKILLREGVIRHVGRFQSLKLFLKVFLSLFGYKTN